MKEYKLNLKDNEELIIDVDDLMEAELAKFTEEIKDLTEDQLVLFNNWVKVYKLLNYDIIEGLEINNVYKFNECSAIIKLTFRGTVEYDLLNLNPTTMTVACMNVKGKTIRPYVTRRLLVPKTVEEALSFAKSNLPNEGIKSVAQTIKELETCGDRYDVTDKIKIQEQGFEKPETENQTSGGLGVINNKSSYENNDQESTEEVAVEETTIESIHVSYNNFTSMSKVTLKMNEDGTMNMRSFITSLR